MVLSHASGRDQTNWGMLVRSWHREIGRERGLRASNDVPHGAVPDNAAVILDQRPALNDIIEEIQHNEPRRVANGPQQGQDAGVNAGVKRLN